MADFNFNEFAASYVDANQKVWGHKRSESLGSSEAFGCLRKAWYSKNDTPKDEDYVESYGAMERGNLLEDNWFVPVMRHGIKKFFPTAKLYGAGKHQTTLIKDQLSTTPDGFVAGLPRDCLAWAGIPDIGQDPNCPEGQGSILTEAKSIDPRVNLSEEKAIHHGQTQVQMGLVRSETDFKPNYAVIIYTDASWLDQNEMFVIKWDPAMYREAQKRAVTVFECDDPLEILPEGRITGDCRYCPFQETCYKGSAGRAPKDDNSDNLAPDQREALKELAAEERALSAEKKAAEKAHKEAMEKLKHRMEEFETKKLIDPDIKISYSWISGKKTLSKDLLAEAGLNPEDYMTEGRGYSKITVTEPK